MRSPEGTEIKWKFSPSAPSVSLVIIFSMFSNYVHTVFISQGCCPSQSSVRLPTSGSWFPSCFPAHDCRTLIPPLFSWLQLQGFEKQKQLEGLGVLQGTCSSRQRRKVKMTKNQRDQSKMRSRGRKKNHMGWRKMRAKKKEH